MADVATTTDTTTTTDVPAAWHASIADEGLRTVASKYESPDKFVEAVGYKPPQPQQADWRAAITDDKLKEHAARFTSADDLVRANLESRQKLSTAIIKPGKDAKPEEITAFRKAFEIPETPEGYRFPELPADQLTDEIKTSRQTWAKRFHDANVSGPQAEALMTALRQDTEAAMKVQLEKDKATAEAAKAELRKSWGNEFDVNNQYAARGFEKMAEKAGVDPATLKMIETKTGDFVLDNPSFARIFAAIGREMQSGDSGTVAVSESAKNQINDQVKDLRAKTAEAQRRGDHVEANRLYAETMKLLDKLGNQPIVGSMGRAA